MDNFDLRKYLAEGKLYENEYFDAYHEAGDKLENHPNYNKLVSILKDKGFEPDGTPYSDGTGRRDVHGVWDVFKSYTTEPGARGTTLTKANAKDINDALELAGIEDIEATPSNSYSFRLKVNNLDEGRMKDPSRSIKMGKYPQVSSDTPVPMNVKYLTTNGEKLTMKVQAKNRKEAVDAVKSKDSNFKAEIKTDFVYDKDGNRILKESLGSDPKYYVKYTTLDGKEVKSELMSKREAIYKERDLVDSGVKKSSVYKFFKNVDLNGKPYIIDTELDKEIDYRKDEKGRPIDENNPLK